MINGADVVEKRRQAAYKDEKNQFWGNILAISFLFVMLVGVIALVIVAKTHYQYMNAYIDKTNTMWEVEYKSSQKKYRVREFAFFRKSNGAKKWRYKKTTYYGTHRPQIEHIYDIDYYADFLNAVDD